MKTLISALITLLVVSCSKPHPLNGKWKSNEDKTLVSMNNTSDIPEDIRNKFSNDFFGKLTIEIDFPNSRAIFDNPQPSESHLLEWSTFKVLKHKDNYWLIEYSDPVSKEEVTSEIYLEDNCYYTLVSKWQFKEYFCQ